MNDNKNKLFKRLPLAAAILGGLTCATSAQAYDFDFGDSEVSASASVTLSYANAFRVTDAETNPGQIGIASFQNGAVNGLSEARVSKAGGLISQVGSGLVEVNVDWRNYGLVLSSSYQYDTEIMDRPMARGELAGTGVAWTEANKNHGGSYGILGDAYVYGSFDIGENPLEVRVGKQSINWGEGLFFLDGNSVQSSLNINKLVTPGSELKEAYIGNKSIYVQMGLGDSSSFEAYVHLDWNRHEMPSAGTFYGADYGFRGTWEADGGHNFLSANPDFNLRGPYGVSTYAPLQLANKVADDDGQFGFNFKTTIGDTEYGVYFSRYHEAFPMFYYDNGGNDILLAPAIDFGDANGNPTGTCDYAALGVPGFPADCLDAAVDAATIAGALAANPTSVGLGQQYDEKQDMLGVSWSTTLGNWSFAGEVAYRPDRKLMTNPFNYQPEGSYLEKDTVNASFNGIWLGGPTIMGIDSQFAIYQVGGDFILDGTTGVAADGTPVALDPMSLITRGPDIDSTHRGATTQAYGAAGLWGGTWNSVLPAVDMTLEAFVQYGIKGNSHYYGNFAEGSTLGALSLTAAIGNAWEASATYSFIEFDETDFEDQDTIGMAVNYKF